MALESVNAAETLIQSNAENDDLEDGEIPSDEDDEPTPSAPVPEVSAESVKPTKQVSKPESPKHKSSFESKFGKSKKSSGGNSSSAGGGGGGGGSSSSSNKQDRFGKYKNPTEDWAGDVEKAIRAVLEEQDRTKSQDNKSKSKSNRSKARKRAREEKEEERAKEQKKRRLSDEENGHEDDDEMLFVRGASPVSRRDGHDTTRSPPRRSTERDNYDNSSDNEDRSSDRRQRDSDNNKRSGGSGGGGSGSGGRSTGRRGGKTDRGGKNKGRQQLRNEPNGRRNQSNEHNQDPDAICLFYMQGKCHRGDDCPFSHNALPPRKMELCKFYLMDCCAKRDKCLYMHHDFPCKFFHTGLKCGNAENCKFSHQPLNEQVKNILLKHLETAPKEILGDFPRLSREGALLMINNKARSLGQGQETGSQKIPSLFDVSLPVPANSDEQPEHEEIRGNLPTAVVSDPNLTVALQQKRPVSSGGKERKPAGKKTRWGSDDDRVPYEQIMLLQSVSQLGLHLPNVALGLAVQQQLQQHILIQQCIANMEFYNEIHGSPSETGVVKEKGKERDQDFTKDVQEDEILANAHIAGPAATAMASKDVDLRQILNANRASAVMSLAEDAASLETSKFDDESDRDEETNLVIEMPVEEEEKDKDEEKCKEITPKIESSAESLKISVNEKNEDQEELSPPKVSKSPPRGSSPPHVNIPASDDQEMLPNLPKKAQELFMRIQQQQRTAKESLSIADEQVEVSDGTKQENWYSDDEDDEENDDDDDDDDDEEAGNLTIVLKDSHKDENEDVAAQDSPELAKSSSAPETPGVPQPAVFVDTLGNLSKIDISAEVTKLLSSIKPQSSKSSNARVETSTPSNSAESRLDDYSSKTISGLSRENNSPFSSPRTSDDQSRSSLINTRVMNILKPENGSLSPKSLSSVAAPISRDPRMSRDPRQRREDNQKSSSTSPSRSNETKKDSRNIRPETSIYSTGLTAMDTPMDTDLRARLDQDHRRQDMDLRQQRYPQQDFGDTDLRVVPANFSETNISRSDVDLRQMLSLPFKPAPSHVPCTEIEASSSSHPPFSYKVLIVDIPRPDYTGLKLTKNDAQVKYDPRLRKIFRLPKVDIADSPMSPPAVNQIKPDTPKSPPQITVRSDPRRKALESTNQNSQNIGPPTIGVGMMQPQAQQMGGVGMQQPQQPDGMGGMQGMPSGAMGGMPGMGPNQIMGMSGMGGMMGGPMAPQNMPQMGMGPVMGGGGPGIGPGNGPIGPNQMNYDPRYAAQRNGGPGLLGPGPGMYGSDVGSTGFDGPPGYPAGNFGNYGPGPGPADPGMMGFGPNGPNPGSFGGNVPPAEWTTGNQNSMRRGNRIRRRNRNRTNTGPNNRGNRSPP